MLRIAKFCACVASICFSGFDVAHAQVCGFETTENSNDLAYDARRIQDYCDGLRGSKFSADSGNIILAGIHLGNPDLPVDPRVQSLIIRGIHNNPGDFEIRLRGTRPVVPQYWLDFRGTGSGSIEREWELDIIRDPRIDLSQETIAALGCRPSCSDPKRTLFPVSISKKDAVIDSSIRFVVIMPVGSQSVSVKIRRDGETEQVAEASNDDLFGVPGEHVEILVSENLINGLYTVVFSAEVEHGPPYEIKAMLDLRR